MTAWSQSQFCPNPSPFMMWPLYDVTYAGTWPWEPVTYPITPLLTYLLPGCNKYVRFFCFSWDLEQQHINKCGARSEVLSANHSKQGFKVLLSFLPLGARKRSYIRTRHSLWTSTCVLLINNYHTFYLYVFLFRFFTESVWHGSFQLERVYTFYFDLVIGWPGYNRPWWLTGH